MLSKEITDIETKDGQLIVIAGRPSMGKTTSMLNQVKPLCGEKNKKVLVFSLEEPKEKTAERLVSLCGNVDHTKMYSGNLDDDNWRNIIGASNFISGWNLVIDDDVDPPVERLCEKIG